MARPWTASPGLREAVHRAAPTSAEGLLERVFTFVFSGLVYPQIWEDPDVDLEALDLAPGGRILTIASGGCNVLAYLTADPASVVAVDLNRAHLALTKLKLAAAAFLPSYAAFHRFFGEADHQANVALYERFLKSRVDPAAAVYWEGRDLFGRRRISLFSRNVYRSGLLGYFIGAAHRLARLYGVDPRVMLEAASLEEQRRIFDETLAPLFRKRLVRWATSKRVSLYGLGIPPAQYEALGGGEADGMAAVLRERLERLACGFPLSENYFAWQAFGRSYPTAGAGPLPPYLRRENFDAIRGRAGRVEVAHNSVTEHLGDSPASAFDAYVLLDAQDWMTDAQLNALWTQITRTARPGARVIFRTAAEPSLLPGRVSADLLSLWHYEAEQSRAFTLADRSSIYGGFHLYRYQG